MAMLTISSFDTKFEKDKNNLLLFGYTGQLKSTRWSTIFIKEKKNTKNCHN